MTEPQISPGAGSDEQARVLAVNLNREADLMEIAVALDEADIPFIVLKGIPLARRLWGTLTRRVIGDNDILVKRKDMFAAFKVLANLGYSEPSLPWLTVLLQVNYEYQLIKERESRERTGVLGLHWAPFLPSLYPSSEGVLWPRTEEFDLRDRSVLVFDKPLTIIHLAAHFAHHGLRHRRLIADFGRAWNLWHSGIDVSDLRRLARSLGLQHVLDHSFLAAAQLDLLEEPYPSPTSRRARYVVRLFPPSRLLDDPGDREYLTRARPLLLVQPMRAARYVWQLTFPPIDMVAFAVNRPVSPLLYLLYPLRPFLPLWRYVKRIRVRLQRR